MKNFICFPKHFFLQNDFIDTKNAVLTGRPNFSCSITGNYPKKSPQKMQKLFKTFFFKFFPWRARKPRWFFFESQPNIFCSIFKKTALCKFCKNFHPKASIETENPVLTTRLLFFAKFGQKNCSVSKIEKKNV